MDTKLLQIFENIRVSGNCCEQANNLAKKISGIGY